LHIYVLIYDPYKRYNNVMGVFMVISESMLAIELWDMIIDIIDRSIGRNVA